MRAPGEYVNAAAEPVRAADGGRARRAGGALGRDGGADARDGCRTVRTLVDLGEHRLRDLAEPMRVFQLAHPGLPREFPPLRSLDAFPGNLPAQLTSFVGREEELAGIAKALDEWRLVTLTGTGGVGKTRLAVQVAAEVLPRFRDGAWLCELAVAADDETMAQVVAAELGVSQRPGMSLEASVSDYLRPKELLLVLDNCEQLLGPVSDARGAGACGSARACGSWRRAARASAVGGRACVAVAVAAAARPGRRASPRRRRTTRWCCSSNAPRRPGRRSRWTRRTRRRSPRSVAAWTGSRLAIELAAARVVSMSPSEISGLLDERFRLLTGGRRTRGGTPSDVAGHGRLVVLAARRTRTDRVRPSRRLRRQLRRRAAAQAVVTGDDVEAWDVLDALTELVAKSMVVAEETADGTTRYQMLETLGQYARERLDEHGDTDEWRRRHAEYFAAWAEEAGPGLDGPDELAWRTRENAELDNLRAAVTWALDRDDPDDIGLALRIVGALAYETHRNPAAGIGAWAERALPHVEITSPQLRYAVTAAAAYHQINLGNYEHAQELAQQAIGDGVPPGAPAPGRRPRGRSRSVRRLLGDPERALAIALDAARRLDRDFPGSMHAAHASCDGSHASQRSRAIRSPAPKPRSRSARHARSANPTALAGALDGVRVGPDRRRPRRGARRARREHRALPSGREPRRVRDGPVPRGGRARPHRRPSPRGA